MLEHSFHEEIVSNVPSTPPLAPFEAISPCPIACYVGEETDPHLASCPALGFLLGLSALSVVSSGLTSVAMSSQPGLVSQQHKHISCCCSWE